MPLEQWMGYSPGLMESWERQLNQSLWLTDPGSIEIIYSLGAIHFWAQFFPKRRRQFADGGWMLTKWLPGWKIRQKYEHPENAVLCTYFFCSWPFEGVDGWVSFQQGIVCLEKKQQKRMAPYLPMGPGTKIHVALLFVKGKISYINRAGTLKYLVWNPRHIARSR